MATMEKGLKIALALAILLGGFFVAQMFRHHVPGRDCPFPASSDTLALRPRTEPGVSGPDELERPTRRAPALRAGRRALVPTILTPLVEDDPPPPLAQAFPPTDRCGSSRWGVAMGLPEPDRLHALGRTHTVVDGDTLAGLAEHYLGSPERAMEIYAANQDVLGEPDVLPIGVQLRLPPRIRSTRESPGLRRELPLVPVRPRNS